MKLRLIFATLAGLALFTTGAASQQLPQGGTLSSLPFASTPFSGAELLLMTQGGVSKKTTLGSIENAFGLAPWNIYLTTLVVNSPAAAAANSTAINAAIQQLGVAPVGGNVWLPCGQIYTAATLLINIPGVYVVGCNGNVAATTFYNVNFTAFGTNIVPTFAGTALKHASPSNALVGEITGGGFVGMTVSGNSIATRLFEMDSVGYATERLFLYNSMGPDAAHFFSGTDNTDCLGPCDNTHNVIDLVVSQFAGNTAAKGAVFDGSTSANFSFNRLDMLGFYCTGVVAEFVSADNNDIGRIVSFHNNSCATTNAIQMDGPTATHPVGGDGNHFVRVSGGGAIYAQGTDTAGVTAGVHNVVDQIDTGNGTPDPTSGTGSGWNFCRDQTNTCQISGNLALGAAAASGNGAFAAGPGAAANQSGALAVGNNVTAGGFYSAALNASNTASGNYSTVGGFYSTDRGRPASTAWASGEFATQGDAQTGTFELRAAATTGSATRLTADGNAAGAANCVNIPSGVTAKLRLDIVAHDATTPTNYASWDDWHIVLNNPSGTAAINAGTTPTPLTGGTTTGIALAATADTTNSCLSLTFTRPSGASNTWHAVAYVRSVEVQ